MRATNPITIICSSIFCFLFQVKYDIVLCAYSLFELESQKKRLETIINLWNKCNGYLVLIEHGTNAGFKLITEARDFLIGGIKENGHVFAPVRIHRMSRILKYL